jgi:hypothetical protein
MRKDIVMKFEMDSDEALAGGAPALQRVRAKEKIVGQAPRLPRLFLKVKSTINIFEQEQEQE